MNACFVVTVFVNKIVIVKCNSNMRGYIIMIPIM